MVSAAKDIKEELIMINQEKGIPPADGGWMGWSNDVRQRAVEVIATTRCEWMSRVASTGPTAAILGDHVGDIIKSAY